MTHEKCPCVLSGRWTTWNLRLEGKVPGIRSNSPHFKGLGPADSCENAFPSGMKTRLLRAGPWPPHAPQPAETRLGWDKRAL